MYVLLLCCERSSYRQGKAAAGKAPAEHKAVDSPVLPSQPLAAAPCPPPPTQEQPQPMQEQPQAAQAVSLQLRSQFDPTARIPRLSTRASGPTAVASVLDSVTPPVATARLAEFQAKTAVATVIATAGATRQPPPRAEAKAQPQAAASPAEAGKTTPAEQVWQSVSTLWVKRASKPCSVMVTGLPQWQSRAWAGPLEAELFAAFTAFGPVCDVRVMPSHSSNTLCFVRFESEAGVAAALAHSQQVRATLTIAGKTLAYR